GPAPRQDGALIDFGCADRFVPRRRVGRGSGRRREVDDASDEGFSGCPGTGLIAIAETFTPVAEASRKHYRLRISAVPFYPGGLKCFLFPKIYGGLGR